MNLTRFHKTTVIVALATAAHSPITSSAPGTLPVSPLFLGASVEPNVYFIADDSGSMEWDLLAQGGSQGLPYIGGWYGNYYILPTRANHEDVLWQTDNPSNTNHYPYVVPDEAYVAGAWIAFNHNYNAMYYNPNVRYSPWPGTDASGNPLYTNSPPSAAPITPGSASTFNMTANFTFTNYTVNSGWHTETIFPAKYYAWTDSDGDGSVDPTDAHSLVQITSSMATYTGSSDRTDCAAAPVCTYAEEIQNFANWFTYYRKRSLTARSAMGTVVNGTDNKRMGLDAFNAGNRVNAVTMSSAANRRTLMENMYSLPFSGGTPARTALTRVGELFEGASSPILGASQGGACQQNFAVMVTDGYWNDSSDPGVGNADGDDNTDFDGGNYADAWEDTLADIAMHYYERDLKAYTDMVRTSDRDTNEGQHLVTFGIAFGLSGVLDPEVDPAAEGFSGWPDPISNTGAERIDDLWHAAYNGRGEYVSADNPQALASGLANALGNIEGRRGSAAAVAFNTTSLSTNSQVYLALFNSDNWDGDLMAYPLDPYTGAISAVASWRAATQLDNRNISSDPRTILTSNGTDGVAFQWSSLTAAQKDDLRTNSAGTLNNEATGMARLGFLRGDRNCEIDSNPSASCNYTDGTNTFNSKTLRSRASRLGDIIHSTPVYVGAPGLEWPAIAPFPTTVGSTYADWKAAHQNRSGVVYVGANDGMLHGFSEGSGAEVMAYVPSQLYSTSSTAGLHYLSDPGYNHFFYVDLAPTVSDVHIRTTVAGTPGWKTILVGGMRSGGTGLFALDVTSPSFSESGTAPADTVLWEFTHRDLGYTFSRPTIAMLDSGDWVAIFGNGYNTTNTGTGSANTSCSTPGQAALFVVKLEGGIDGTWTEGTDYYVVCTGQGTEAARNGLATPAVVDTDGNGTADRVYAGDLLGNLWAFSLGATPSVAYAQGGTPRPLFTAASGQSITTAPEVVRNTSVTTSNSNLPNTLVLFGTGQYLVTADTTSTTQQAFYGIWDHGTRSLTQANLIQQTVTTSGDMRTLSDNTVSYSNSVHGWYFNLPATRERIVNNPLVRGDVVLFTTTIPDSDPCLGGGTGWLMAVNYLTGGNTEEIEFDYNGDGVLDELDKPDGDDTIEGKKLDDGLGMPSDAACMGNNCYISGTNVVEGDEVSNTGVKELGGIGTGRLSWEELRCPPSDANCTR